MWLTLGITKTLLETKNIQNQSLMVMLLIVPWLLQLANHFHVKNLKMNESLNVNLEEKKLINCCFSQNITKHKLKLTWCIHAISFYLCKYLNKYLGNQLITFISTWTKRATFTATKIYIMHTTIIKIVHPLLSKDMKGPMQIKRGKCNSFMLLCLKINCMNLRNK